MQLRRITSLICICNLLLNLCAWHRLSIMNTRFKCRVNIILDSGHRNIRPVNLCLCIERGKAVYWSPPGVELDPVEVEASGQTWKTLSNEGEVRMPGIGLSLWNLIQLFLWENISCLWENWKQSKQVMFRVCKASRSCGHLLVDWWWWKPPSWGRKHLGRKQTVDFSWKLFWVVEETLWGFWQSVDHAS